MQAAPPDGQRRRHAVILAVECGRLAAVFVAAAAAGICGAVPLDPPARFFGLAALLAVAMGLRGSRRGHLT